MDERKNFWLENFKGVIFENSENKEIYDKAIQEWESSRVYFLENYGDDNCICTHEIKEVWVIKNKINGKELKVGNCCIEKIIMVEHPDLAKARKAIVKNEMNRDLILISKQFNLINDWEYDFSMDIWRKRNLSDRQMWCANRIFKKMKDGLMKQ